MKLGIAGAAAAVSTSRARAEPARRLGYVLFFALGGGIDALLTTDPKVKSDVANGIDSLHGDDVVDAGSLLLGPHLRPLAPWASKLAIVQGIRVKNVSHRPGAMQLSRLKLGFEKDYPSILELIGQHRNEQAVGAITVGDEGAPVYTPGWMPGSSIFGATDHASSEELEIVASGLRKQRQHFGPAQNSEVATTLDNIEQSARLFDALKSTPRFVVEKWSSVEIEQHFAVQFQRILWILRNDLSRCVKHNSYQWDTHQQNLTGQARSSGAFFPMFARFLEELYKQRNVHGLLADNTTILLGSELGRNPRLNDFNGKDHFPEVPFLVMGKHIRPGVYGRTGKQMEALPVSFKTGREARSGNRFIDLDDLGTTLLRLSGLNPRPFGYEGELLDFLIS